MPERPAPVRSALISRSTVPLLARSARAPRGAARAPVKVKQPWHRLDCTIPLQEQTQWCWCATSLGVHQYYDRTDSTTQCQAANLILGRSDACSSPSSAAINKPYFLDEALGDFGNLNGSIIAGTLAFADVQAQIDGGTPLGTRIAWSGGGAHFMVIEGYRAGTTRWVAIHDPIYGESDLTYATYSTAYQGTGSWSHSYKTKSHRIRILDLVTVPAGSLTAVSRKPQLLDVFAVDKDGRVKSAASDLGAGHGRWRGWWHLQGGLAKPGARVACVARQPDLLDIFVVGTDGGIYTAAWDANQAAGAWRGWWRIGSLVVPADACIAAVARHPGKLDIFVVDGAGRVMSAAWQSGDTAWRGWWHIQGGMAKPGAFISAVARSTEKLDIFVVGTNGGVYTAAWDAKQAKGAWRGWWRIGSLLAAQGAPVTSVARASGKLDVFAVDNGGRICTAAWDAAVPGGWRGWWHVAGGMAAQGTAVPCTARSPNHLDIAVVGTDGGLYTAAWEPGVASGAWRGWWRIGTGLGITGADVELLHRTSSSLDGFSVGQNGAVYTWLWDGALAGGHWRG